MAPKRIYNRVLSEYICRQKEDMDVFALDLLEKMLTFNPDHRISAAEALSHPYFQSYPLPSQYYELPRVDQDCHTFIINNKRKNNLKASEANKQNLQNVQNAQYAKPKLVAKNVNPAAVLINNPQPAAMATTMPINYQYNNFYNCNNMNQYNNIKNINVNLIIPSTSSVMPTMPHHQVPHQVSHQMPHQITQMPQISQMSQVSQMSHMQQQMPQMPQLPQMSNVPQLSKLAQMPQMAQVPQMTHQMNQIPQKVQMNQLNQIPQKAQISQMSQMPTVPQLSKLAQMPQMAQVPQMTHQMNSNLNFQPTYINQTNNMDGYNNMYFNSAYYDPSLMFPNLISMTANPVNSYSYMTTIPQAKNVYMSSENSHHQQQMNHNPVMYNTNNQSYVNNNDQYTNMEKSYYAMPNMSDFYMQENLQTLKRQPSMPIDEFEPTSAKKRQLGNFMQPYN